MIIPIAAFLMLAIPAQAKTKNVQDFLPLAVGNSWTYKHEFADARNDPLPTVYLTDEFTISILRTEVIDGETYYVFSDISTTMPEGIPRHFLNGKKLRWDGNNLTEHDGTDSFSLFRFDLPQPGDSSVGEYPIQETYGDTLVRTYASATDRVVEQYFQFFGNQASPSIRFSGNFGLTQAIQGWAAGDMILARNLLTPVRAVFQTPTQGDGTRDTGRSSSVTVEWDDFDCYFAEYDRLYGTTCHYPPTSTSDSSWGSLKDRSDSR